MNRGRQWIMLDNFRRKLFLKKELKQKLLKSLVKNSSLPVAYRYIAAYNRVKINRWSFIVQQRNRCAVTGRVWSVMRYTKYSRFVFRTESYKGNLPGFSRASW